MMKAIALIRGKKGLIHTTEAIKSGIHPRTLYALRDANVLEQISRGIYHLKEGEAISNIDLVTVASRTSHAVICLISALSFHNLTTQIPHEVSIAIERNSRYPKIDYPPISVYQFSSKSFRAGIEEHEIDGVKVRIYNLEKTLVDCFKFRNKIGMDVLLEALKFYRTRQKLNFDKLFKYAKICRVVRIMTPYLEAML